MAHSLSALPDDVLFLIFNKFESARDLRALALSCQRLHALVKQDGWRIFVRMRFPSLVVPAPPAADNDGRGWARLADSLTWQSRCWDRRAFEFTLLKRRSAGGRASYASRRALFQPVVDAHLDPWSGHEVVVWAEGENITARYRDKRKGDAGKLGITWLSSDDDRVYRAGRDDVRALTIVDDRAGFQDGLAVVEGRDNGDLAIRSIEPDRFGKILATLGPRFAEESRRPQLPTQDVINSIDVLRNGAHGRIAVATKSDVLIYGVPGAEDGQLQVFPPLTTWAVENDMAGGASPVLCHATWVDDGNLLALAMKGCKDPLRYLTFAPDGWAYRTAAKTAALDSHFNVKNICPNSLQPVTMSTAAGSRARTNLLLSAWKDGTCRLQDLRTPSPFDALYQDNVDPYSPMEVLLPYGAERFIGGGIHGPTVKIFDFRWPKSYYHTAGLPCTSRLPYPPPAQPFVAPPSLDDAHGCQKCDYVSGRLCRWHSASRHIYYRPDASIFLARDLPYQASMHGIWSLARASDVSPNFYIGVAGAVVEATLGSSSSPGAETSDPNFHFPPRANAPATPSTLLYAPKTMHWSMMETGVGVAVRSFDRAIRLPPMLTRFENSYWAARGGGGGGGGDGEVVRSDTNPAPAPDPDPRRHRLDLPIGTSAEL